MPDILHQVRISATLKDAMKMVTSLEGIGHWWASCKGQYKLRDKFTVQFDKQTVEMKVISIEKNRVEWRCTRGSTEWKKTRVVFKFKRQDDALLLNFSHRDWKDASQKFRRHNTQWAELLLGLKEQLEKK